MTAGAAGFADQTGPASPQGPLSNYASDMSFEGDKARLIKELEDAQAEIKAAFGMKPRPEPSTTGEDAKRRGPGKLSAVRDR
jgi:hypothetical protein